MRQLVLACALSACGNLAPTVTADAARDAVSDGLVADLTVWPNAVSFANSDPWLAAHHAELRQLRPHVLALNFVNSVTNDQMLAHLAIQIRAFREGSRYHGYVDATAQPMLEFQIEKAVDLRDAAPPTGWPYHNSTLYPRQSPVQGRWGFDYAALFTPAFAARIGIPDPVDGHPMDLCELVNAGRVHEVWIYGDADVPDVSAAEILELKPRYDAARVRLADGSMDPCAGNGCFDPEDVAALPASCTRTLRIGWVNHARGPGCYMESEHHGFESTALHGVIPYLVEDFREFGDFDLDTRYGTPFPSWYACGTPNCITYTSQTSVSYNTGATTGTIASYQPVCGNAHVPPNGRTQYDDQSPATTISSCEHFRMADGPGGTDLTEPFTSTKFRAYDSIAADCAGGWHVYWMQSLPGVPARAQAKDGSPMLAWLPFLYY